MKRFRKLIHGGKSSSQDGYQYDELSRGGYFRYLILQPGAGDEPLRCSLHTAHLPKKPLYRTKFEAISYVWGSNIKDQVILCDGRTLNITTNLFKVLHRVRRTDTPRKLWADSICINQDDLEEKGYQVANMGEIYRAAQSVIIYMGSDDGGHGPPVSSLLDDVNAMIEDALTKIDMSWDSFPHPEGNERLLRDPRWHSFRNLLSQAWFNRGWVVREAAFAQFGQVIWGQSKFSWEGLMRAYTWLTWRAPGTYYSTGIDACAIISHHHAFKDRNRSFAQAFYKERASYSPSLLDALQCAKTLDLADPRDRIFAFTELSLKSDQQIRLYPNYKDSPSEIYRQFATQYIQVTKDACILDYVTHDYQTLAAKAPSWVPRWNLKVYPIDIAAQFHGPALISRTNSKSIPKVINHTTLQVQGVMIDTVLHTSDILSSSTMTPEVIRDLWNFVKLNRTNSPYEASRLPNVLIDTLCAGQYSGDWDEWVQCKAEVIASAQLPHLDKNKLDLSSESEPKLEEKWNLLYKIIASFTHCKRFIITKRGYFALAPAVTKKGDVCGIIFGCRYPCILRQAARQHHYIHLGASFITGEVPATTWDDYRIFSNILGEENSKDWLDWDVEEQDIYLC